MRANGEATKAMQDEALARAVQSQAMTNLPTIYQAFMERGIPESEIRPRENVFTFHAWKALGRSVRRGEHGVRIVTWVPVPARLNEDGTEKYAAGKRAKTAYVFHVSQTDAMVRQ
jgi:antirestriction protein ArdC